MTSPFKDPTSRHTPMKVSFDGGNTWLTLGLDTSIMVAVPDFDEDDTGPMDLLITVSKSNTDMSLMAQRVEREDGTMRSSVVYDRESLFDVMS